MLSEKFKLLIKIVFLFKLDRFIIKPSKSTYCPLSSCI